jgi:hypothetical protein
LVGLTETELSDVLGKPEAVSERPPAKIWSYRVDSCALDVFFYLDLDTESFRALTYDVRTTTRGGREDAIELCVGRIQTDRRGRTRKS